MVVISIRNCVFHSWMLAVGRLSYFSLFAVMGVSVLADDIVDTLNYVGIVLGPSSAILLIRKIIRYRDESDADLDETQSYQ